MNSEGKVFKIIKFAHNVTEEKLKSLEFEGQISAINNTMGSIEFNLDGTIIHANEIFLKAMGYKLTEVKGHHHKIFIDEEYAMSEEYKSFWEDLQNGKSQTGEFNRLRKDKSRIKITANYTPILDDEGKPFKIIKFAQVVSEVLA
ncbi:MAG: PAS domain-containing protein, partial [Bacteroidota bacterium]